MLTYLSMEIKRKATWIPLGVITCESHDQYVFMYSLEN